MAEPEPPRSQPLAVSFCEAGFQLIGSGAQEDDVAGGAVHVQEAAAVLIPDVAEFPQGLGGVKPAGGLVDAHGVEMLHAGEFIRQVGVTADDAGAVTQDADDAAMLPVGDLVLIRPFQLPQQVIDLGFSERPPASDP